MFKKLLAVGFAAAMCLPALALPVNIEYSGTYNGTNGNPPYPFAQMGDSFQVQLSFDSDNFTSGGAQLTPWGVWDEVYTGSADWTGLIGTTALSWNGPTSFLVRDAVDPGWADVLIAYTPYWSDIFGASRWDVMQYTTVGDWTTFSGTSLSNLSAMTSMTGNVPGWFNYTNIHGYDESWSNYSESFGNVNVVGQATVPEPSAANLWSEL